VNQRPDLPPTEGNEPGGREKTEEEKKNKNKIDWW